MNMSPRLDVAILTKDSEDTIVPCIDSVLKEVPVKRLIIVDASSDRTLEQIEGRFGGRVKTVILQDKGIGCGNARQLALENVDTSLFSFIDSDVILPNGWYNSLIPFFEKDIVGVCSGLPLFGHGDRLVEKLYRYEYFDLDLFTPSLSNTILRRDVVREVGGFDQSLIAGEDHDLFVKVTQAGYDWILNKDVLTPHPRTVLEDIKNQIFWSKGTASLDQEWLKHVQALFRDEFRKNLKALVKIDLGFIMYYPLRRLIWLIGYLWNCRGIKNEETRTN